MHQALMQMGVKLGNFSLEERSPSICSTCSLYMVNLSSRVSLSKLVPYNTLGLQRKLKPRSYLVKDC